MYMMLLPVFYILESIGVDCNKRIQFLLYQSLSSLRGLAHPRGCSEMSTRKDRILGTQFFFDA